MVGVGVPSESSLSLGDRGATIGSPDARDGWDSPALALKPLSCYRRTRIVTAFLIGGRPAATAPAVQA